MNKIFLSCEHGGNQIPAWLKTEIKIPKDVLNSHRGWDPGALGVAKDLAKKMHLPITSHLRSRLVSEYNRSAHHPRLWSEFSAQLPENKRASLLSGYHKYRAGVCRNIQALLKKTGAAQHFSIHSFTPIMNGEVRDCDIGLLYDPANKAEKEICHQLKRSLSTDYKVRMNYPYQGKSDGLTTALRKYFGRKYCGVEVEINQKLIYGVTGQKQVANALFQALKSL
ncbi:MAG: N-formylglutamate amidohydrolase [Bacteriovoracaceae bacterium]|nr:N-formylglutamate amidohydrolase [Bacteriovoracaceae bacterium]